MDDLESTGVIDEYTVDIEYGALGYDVTAVFQLSVEGDGLDGWWTSYVIDAKWSRSTK